MYKGSKCCVNIAISFEFVLYFTHYIFYCLIIYAYAMLCSPSRAMALEAVRRLVFERGADVIGTDRERIHGTVVWCLSSDQENEVQYHIDYAELFRYETNVIHPPLYAGTCHVSPFAATLADGRPGLGRMEGGDFMANSSGKKERESEYVCVYVLYMTMCYWYIMIAC